MYLNDWMVFSLILSFGVCAVYNRRSGYRFGTIDTLRRLHETNIIEVLPTGEILGKEKKQ